ncbi:MAG: ABC transporter permease [Thermoleophilia bacterium]|nr:ABC transporter permease [Thermoleophilia bacterium]
MVGFALVFSLGPLLVLAVFSFNDFPYYSLPLKGFTTQWYSELFANEQIGDGLGTSLIIGGLVSVLATVLGTVFALGGARVQSRRGKVLFGLGLIPLVTPALVLGIGSQIVFVQAGIPLSKLTVTIAQATAFTPFVVLMVTARLTNFQWNLLHAARDLGAGPGQAFRAAVLPAVRPGIVSGFLIVFLMSFSDFIIGFFTGRGFYTLPSLLYSMQRVGISPMLLAYATVIVLVALAVALTLRSVFISIAQRRGGPVV